MKNHANHDSNHATNHATNPAVIGKPRQPRQNSLTYMRDAFAQCLSINKYFLLCVVAVVAVVAVVLLNNQIVIKKSGVVCGVVCFSSGVVFKN